MQVSYLLDAVFERLQGSLHAHGDSAKSVLGDVLGKVFQESPLLSMPKHFLYRQVSKACIIKQSRKMQRGLMFACCCACLPVSRVEADAKTEARDWRGDGPFRMVTV